MSWLKGRRVQVTPSFEVGLCHFSRCALWFGTLVIRGKKYHYPHYFLGGFGTALEHWEHTNSTLIIFFSPGISSSHSQRLPVWKLPSCSLMCYNSMGRMEVTYTSHWIPVLSLAKEETELSGNKIMIWSYLQHCFLLILSFTSQYSMTALGI